MKRKLTAVFLAAFLILGNTAGVLAADSSDQTVPQAAGELVIYHTNDTHGYLSDGSVSIDQVAGPVSRTPPRDPFWWMQETPLRACRWHPSRKAPT